MDITRDAKKRLAALVEERGGALAPLAAKIGVSQSTLWNFIYGETRNFSKIHRLATELKVSLDWIIGGDRPVAAAGRGARRLSESATGQGFESAAADSDAILIRNIALAVATVAPPIPP